jgi:serine/threonine protein kinase
LDDSSLEFREWISLRENGSSPDFEHIQGFKSVPRAASDCVVDLASFELVKGLSDNVRVPLDLFAHRANGWQIAVKSFPKLSPDEETIFWCEVDALVRLDHPCIVPFFGFLLQVPLRDRRISTRFMAGGSLKEVLASRPAGWTSTAKSIVVAGIASGLARRYESGIIHCDLKPGNILLDENRRPQICHFGSSREQTLGTTITGRVGTPLYMAPELNGHDDYDGESRHLLVCPHSLRDCRRFSRVLTAAVDAPARSQGREG